MPEIHLGARVLQAEVGSNLLDTLLNASINVPYSCRAGSCQACMVRCQGDVLDQKPDVLTAATRAEGWRLACQCQVAGDVRVEVFDPVGDGISAQVRAADWLSERVLRLALEPQRRLRYHPGQHVLVWAGGVARPYSLASVPDDRDLELHIACGHRGAFADQARLLQVGDTLQLGQVSGGALHYDAQWQQQPLLLIAFGTGLAALMSVLREALASEHTGPIHLLHIVQAAGEHYYTEPLQQLQRQHPNLQVEYRLTAQLADALAQLRLVPKKSVALLCGQPNLLEQFAKGLYLAGIARKNMFSDAFLPHA